jgi:hypothetical protein
LKTTWQHTQLRLAERYWNKIGIPLTPTTHNVLKPFSVVQIDAQVMIPGKQAL